MAVGHDHFESVAQCLSHNAMQVTKSASASNKYLKNYLSILLFFQMFTVFMLVSVRKSFQSCFISSFDIKNYAQKNKVRLCTRKNMVLFSFWSYILCKVTQFIGRILKGSVVYF